jgi:hypothetical protein
LLDRLTEKTNCFNLRRLFDVLLSVRPSVRKYGLAWLLVIMFFFLDLDVRLLLDAHRLMPDGLPHRLVDHTAGDSLGWVGLARWRVCALR